MKNRNRFGCGRLAFGVAAAMVVAAGAMPALADDGGWTSLSPGASSRVIYASSSSGSDSNSGLSSTAPVRTLSKAYSLLRDGSPDWVLLKAGDTWNETFPTFGKSANSNTDYMVISSYGTGARPKIRANGTAIFGAPGAQRRGLAIMDLDLSPVSPGSSYQGILFLESWGHVLIEGCSVIGYPVNIVMQESGSGRLPDMRVRRCIIADSNETGSPHSQGIFLGACDNWVIEGCILDNNARNKADLFCHNAYVHETNGPGIFKDNISARACSHGVQQRPGGNMENNLFMQNPINAYQAKSASAPAPTNYFRYNVALDSRDINSSLPRGFGFVIGDAPNTVVEFNVAAHQRSGSANVTAFDFAGVNAATVRSNVVYDWTFNGAGWGTGYMWEGGSGAVLFENNQAYQPNHGMCVRHESRSLSSSFTYKNNKYYSTNPAGGYEAFSRSSGVGGNWNWWKSQATEANSTFASPGTIDATIDAYLVSIGGSGSLAEFMAQARQQSRQNWRSQYTADAVNTWVRGRFGIGGGTPTPCFANCDASTTTPVLNANDFQCFMNRFAAGETYANCDGSTVAPVLNANDFQCFLNRFALGCN